MLLDARVYNYSVATPTDPMNVRFDLEPVDPLHNYKPTGKGRFTVGTVAVPSIPYHGQTDDSDKVLNNYTSVRYQLDTSAVVVGDVSRVGGAGLRRCRQHARSRRTAGASPT